MMVHAVPLPSTYIFSWTKVHFQAAKGVQWARQGKTKVFTQEQGKAQDDEG